MSRTSRKSKSPGYEYWSRRNNYNTEPGKKSKIKTHRWERRQRKIEVRKELEQDQ